MRLLYFTRDYTPHDHRFLAALAQTRHEIYSLRLEKRARFLEDRTLPKQVLQIKWRGGQKKARIWMLPSLLQDLKRVIADVKPDLVHAGSIQTAAFLTALSGFQPLVSMSWGSDMLVDAERSPLMRLITRFTLDRTSILFGDCQAVRRKAEKFGFPGDNVSLFPWGVDLQLFSPGPASQLRTQLGWNDKFVLLSNRSWEPLYGVDVLARAFVRAAQQAPELRLLLLGSGSQENLLRQLLSSNHIQDKVYFGGRVSNDSLTDFYRSADLYVSASHSDGSSVSLMEALGCGKPVLVSDIPGNLEWITHGKQGYVFQDNNEKALAEGILRALNNRHRLPEMELCARKLAEARADWQKNIQKMLHGYEKALRMNT